ncbi:DUF2298 domain-containing protein [Chitinilyticum piscinae]|uniref:Chlor_Arch_YYY domain-containing protein n=1 Tax=Chitinilyticum piscinae TaxID=2866724 RepID=A0A8J7FQG0_9NEIS|nr:DUF2298 domain-containing protein [Chitinilyticum piscinae]MBE9610394.1 hypothetical protein [Chitinilyticum piscinae]
MHLIYLLLTVGLILFNLSGLTALMWRMLPASAAARTAGILLLTVCFFALEHFHGLGALAWLWPLATVLSGMVLAGRRDWRTHREFWAGEAVFVLCFLYGLAWRFAFPNIDAGSEHLTDLYFISNYMPGTTLPPTDRWLVGGVFDFYYAFQHYGAALLARIFNLDAGMAMNLGWALLIGLLGSLAWEIASRFIAARGLRVLLVATLLLGGNGLSPLMPFMIKPVEQPIPAGLDAEALRGYERGKAQAAAQDRLWESTRFAGMFDERVNTSLGRAVAGDPANPMFRENRELPLETVAYLSYLGDYHPPLGGLVLLLWALALTLAYRVNASQHEEYEAEAVVNSGLRQNTLVCILLGASPALVLVTNAWVFPLQALLLAAWLFFRRSDLARIWRPFLGGLLLALALIYPFLSHFAPASLATPLAWVSMRDHSPLPYFLALHWPFLLLALLGMLLGRTKPWAGWLAISLLLLLAMSELVVVDDPLGGKYERFNTTLKWWSWLWPAALVGLGSVVLGCRNLLVRALGIVLCAALLVYAVAIASYWLHTDKPNKGQLAGNGWLKQDDTARAIITHLRNSPDGIVLEAVEQGAYSPSSAIALNAGKGVVLGWPDHVGQWRGQPAQIPQLANDIRAFYRGQLADPLGWLNQNRVQYIVWTWGDESRAPGVRQQLHVTIGRDYHWRPFYQNGAQEAGIWERRSAR